MGRARGDFRCRCGRGRHLLKLNVVLGEKYPPDAPMVLADGDSPLRSLKVKYYAPEGFKPHFWTPIKSKPNWDPGWLWVYLVVYVPAMFGIKWGLRVV